MRKVLPYVVSGLVFLVALALVQPEPTFPMIVAARNLPAGHTIVDGDLAIEEVPERLLPADAITFIGLHPRSESWRACETAAGRASDRSACDGFGWHGGPDSSRRHGWSGRILAS